MPPGIARSVLFNALRLTLLSLLALALLLGTGWLCAAAVATLYGNDAPTPANLSVGLVCGLIVWLFIAIFHLRKETLTLAAADTEWFMQAARLLLKEMGYEVTARDPLQLVTRPRFHSFLLGGGIQIRVRGSSALVTGPKVCVELLRNRLRVQCHLTGVRHALREQHRHSEPLIKRAELRLRATPEQIDAIQVNVIDLLHATAEVVCDIHILAQSNVGIPESTLEFQVGVWLEQQGIEATLHKHFVQLHRPLSGGDIVLGAAQ